MSIADAVNGSFETVGGLMQLSNCLRLYWDKQVAGVNWQVTAFMVGWGVWNLYFYPSLGQWASFAGGLVIVAANVLWVGMAWRYR